MTAAGESNGQAKLSDKTARLIARSRGSQRELAPKFGVCKSTIGNVRQGKTWAHLGLDIDAETIAHANNIAARSGERNGAAKLTRRKVAAIRRSKKAQRDAARIYGVSKSLIGNIRRGENWKATP